MTDSEEAGEHQPMEEELTDMSRASKVKKRKKKKHHCGGGRNSVKDGIERGTYPLPQYWPNRNSCPTKNEVTPALSKVQTPSWDCTGKVM